MPFQFLFLNRHCVHCNTFCFAHFFSQFAEERKTTHHRNCSWDHRWIRWKTISRQMKWIIIHCANKTCESLLSLGCCFLFHYDIFVGLLFAFVQLPSYLYTRLDAKWKWKKITRTEISNSIPCYPLPVQPSLTVLCIRKPVKLWTEAWKWKPYGWVFHLYFVYEWVYSLFIINV